SSDNNDFRARGWGWLGSLETGLPFSITDNLMLEPQLQYTWQGLSLDDGQDNAGYVKFGHGSAQHVRAGGSNMTFSPSRNGTSLDLQAGLEARIRENITLGVQGGYAHSVSGSSAEGYNGQATLNVTF
ncbi:autotransporter domain-containing protein, partial [Escherichia coli]|uniref:autotransporter domain-containing protein n=1 Tax=Escherichia coli TaxID=562 RepID=UPI001F4BA681